MRQKLFFILCLALCLGCNTTRPTTSAYYDLNIKYLRTDVNGSDFFKVYANCSSEADCRRNAKSDLIKQLLYQGVTQGFLVKPILSSPVDQEKFKQNESQNLIQIIKSSQIVNDGSISKSDRLKAGDFLKMGVTISVNRKELEFEIKKILQ
jgi:hypothetical protein